MTTDQPHKTLRQLAEEQGLLGSPPDYVALATALFPTDEDAEAFTRYLEGRRQPTPTSSLEEARPIMVGDAGDFLGIWRFSDPPTMRELLDAYIEAEGAIRAARAEAIREVEAAIREKLGVTSRALAVVRALSQGGEGKSDG